MPLDQTFDVQIPITKAAFLRVWQEKAGVDQSIDEAREAGAAARASKRDIFKRLAGHGIKKPVIKLLEAVAAMEQAEREDFAERVAMLADWLKVPLWHAGTAERPQGEMFAEAAKAEAAAADQEMGDAVIKGDAWNSAKLGAVETDNPHTAGTREHALWLAEWARYRIGDDDDEAEPSQPPKRGRGRPRKDRSNEVHASA